RTPEMVTDGDDSVAFLIGGSNLLAMVQRGADVSLGVGDAVGLLHAEPAKLTISPGDWFSLVVPRASLAPLVPDVEAAAMKPIPCRNEPLRLLTKYLGILRDDPALITPELRHSAVTHIYDLMAMTLGASRDGAVIASKRGIRAARLRAVKEDILSNLGNPELSSTVIALGQRITPRYVHMLFEGEGTTFSEYVLNQRLQRAHR